MSQARKLNILYFAPCRPDEGVGGGARLKNMLDVLVQVGAEVRLISYWPEQKFRVTHGQTGDHLKTTIVSVRKSSPKVLKLFGLGSVFGHGLRHIRRNQIVVAHAPSIVSGFPATVLARLFRKPVIIDLTDVRDPQTPKSLYDRLLKGADAVFSVSRYLEGKARELGCRNVVCIPVIIDTSVFQPDPAKRMDIRRKLGIADGSIVIGYAGSFWHIEGLALLLRVFERLNCRHQDLRLVLVGGRNVPGSDDVPRLANDLGIAKRVILVPPQPHGLMPEYLSAFDIACSPKIDCPENQAASPIKVHEYMSMGLPTVVSAIGETTNIIEHGKDGFLVKPGDEADLERALELVIQNLDSAKEIGQRARQKIIRDYGPEATRQRVRDTLSRLARKSIVRRESDGK